MVVDPKLGVQVQQVGLELDPDPLAELGPVPPGIQPQHPDRARPGTRSPSIVSTVVVLPAPLGPTIPKISPRSTVNDTSSTATVPPSRLCRCSTSTTGTVRGLLRVASPCPEDAGRARLAGGGRPGGFCTLRGVRPIGDRRRRWLLLHAGVVTLIGVLGSGIWLIAERGQGMTTVFWPGLIVLMLLVPLALHAAVVFMTAPARPRPGRDVPASVPVTEAGERALATVLFTDIVGSTELARRVGDRRWSELLDLHDRLARELVGQLGGRLVKSTGDGILALFDRPGRGIRCATGLRDRLRDSGVELRAGVHTGEVQLRGDDVGGIGVHVAARVMAAAAPGEVLVSSTVHDLVAGSDYVLEDRGPHALKGVGGEWRLFAVRA